MPKELQYRTVTASATTTTAGPKWYPAPANAMAKRARELMEASYVGVPEVVVRFSDGSRTEYRLVDKPKTDSEKLAQIEAVVNDGPATHYTMVQRIREVLRDA